MKRTLLLFALLCGLFLSTSCVSLERLTEIANDASVKLEQAEQYVDDAESALAAARSLAEATGSEKALAAVEKAEAALELAVNALPAVQDSAKTAAEALETAIAAREAGWGVSDFLVNLLSASIPLAGGIYAAVRGRRWKDLAAHGLQLANDLKHRAEDAGAKVDDVISSAAAYQEGKGTKADVDKLRKG